MCVILIVMASNLIFLSPLIAEYMLLNFLSFLECQLTRILKETFPSPLNKPHSLLYKEIYLGAMNIQGSREEGIQLS